MLSPFGLVQNALMRLPRARVLGPLAVVLGVVPPAWGVTRYAVPAGSGPEPCAASNPCSLERAIEDAPNHDDEVIVAPGAYVVSGGAGPDCSAGFSPGALAPSKRLTIRGVPGQPRPTINAASGTCAALYSNFGGTLRHLELRQPNAAGLALGWGRASSTISSSAAKAASRQKS